VKTGAAAYILGNWQVNGLMAAYTGVPFTVTAPGASLNAPNNLQTADQVKNEVQFLGQPGSLWYDKTAFAPVTGQRFGSAGRNILRGPGVWNTDLSIFKNFPIKEQMVLQFRAEFFNFPNTSHFGSPTDPSGSAVASRNVTSSNFMIMNQSYGERQIRFGLRFAF
jgi:hypothetical protein